MLLARIRVRTRQRDAQVLRFADLALDVSTREVWRTRRMSAAGLGLPIARQIADQHGVRLEVRSEAGHGTVFTVQMPWVAVSEPVPTVA